jgi:hypothetical protein
MYLLGLDDLFCYLTLLKGYEVLALLFCCPARKIVALMTELF